MNKLLLLSILFLVACQDKPKPEPSPNLFFIGGERKFGIIFNNGEYKQESFIDRSDSCTTFIFTKQKRDVIFYKRGDVVYVKDSAAAIRELSISLEKLMFQAETKRRADASPEFHVVVYESMGLFFVKVTNDDWATEEGILGCSPQGNVEKIKAFESQGEALRVAKKFNCYSDFLDYNWKVKNSCKVIAKSAVNIIVK